MFRKEEWNPKFDKNYIIFDREDSKEHIIIAIEDNSLIIAVQKGSKWIVKAKNPMNITNLFKLKHLVEEALQDYGR